MTTNTKTYKLILYHITMRKDTLAEKHPWMKHALKEDIKEVIISPEMLRVSKIIAEEPFGERMHEEAGYFQGSLQGETLYIFSRHMINMGDNSEVEITRESFLDEEVGLATARNTPKYNIVMYHNHPRITPEILKKELPNEANEIIEAAKYHMDLEMCDNILKNGIKNNLENTLTELLTKSLSPEDIKGTPGKYHFLITDTTSPKNKFSHINFYDIKKMETIPVRQARNIKESAALEDLAKIDMLSMKEARNKVYGVTSQKEFEKKMMNWDYLDAFDPQKMEEMRTQRVTI